MFSSRIPWDLRPNPISRVLSAKRAAGIDILDLTESNPTRAGFDYPAAEILASLADPRSMLYEPAPWGLATAREAVAEYHGVDVERVMLTASTSESYGYLFKLLCDPGDQVLTPRPSYPLFEFLAALESVSVSPYDLFYDRAWRIDFDSLERAATQRARAVLLVNPNNPTGSYLKKAELDRLVEFCARRDLAIVSDEVFAEYAFAHDDARVATLAGVDQALTFCLNGLSKAAGLPQMKAGWILMGGPEMKRAEAARRLELIADTFLSISTPVQHALPGLMTAGVHTQILARTRANLDFLTTAARPLTVEGGWYAIIDVGNENLAQRLLEQHDVLVQPGFFYDFGYDGYLVLSLLTPVQIFQEGVRRVITAVTEAAGTP